MEKFFKLPDDLLSRISLLGITLFISGFIVWNVYLSSLGFSEDSIIETRFILTGFFFILITLVSHVILYFLFRIIKKLFFLFTKIKIKNEPPTPLLVHSKILLIAAWTVFWVTVYSVHFFPSLPFALGGGKPRYLSFLLSDPEKISLFNSMGIGINTPQGAKNQTIGLCVAYESKEKTIIFQDRRILTVDRDTYNGLVSLPEESNIERESICEQQAKCWSLIGFYSKFHLLKIKTTEELQKEADENPKKVFFCLSKISLPHFNDTASATSTQEIPRCPVRKTN